MAVSPGRCWVVRRPDRACMCTVGYSRLHQRRLRRPVSPELALLECEERDSWEPGRAHPSPAVSVCVTLLSPAFRCLTNAGSCDSHFLACHPLRGLLAKYSISCINVMDDMSRWSQIIFPDLRPSE